MPPADQYYDGLETRDPEQRERALFAALPGQIAQAKARAPGWARILAAVGSVRKALVSGEAFPPALRQRFAAAGIAALQCYASADLGLIAYESAARDGLIVDEGIILEIVRPGTGEPTPPGEIGEVVVTTLTADYPLIRFGTGDLSALLAGPSPCGRTNHRIKGWMGRADRATKVRGMFVHPAQIGELLQRHKAIIRARLVVGQDAAGDTMTLKVEMGEPAEDPARIAQSLQALTKLRGAVELVPQGSLSNDGKVIEDVRKHA